MNPRSLSCELSGLTGPFVSACVRGCRPQTPVPGKTQFDDSRMCVSVDTDCGGLFTNVRVGAGARGH